MVWPDELHRLVAHRLVAQIEFSDGQAYTDSRSSGSDAPGADRWAPYIRCEPVCCNSALISARCGSTDLVAVQPPYVSTTHTIHSVR